MSEAFLMNHGNGMRFRRLFVSVMPNKTHYKKIDDVLDPIDLSGAEIMADFGNDTVLLANEGLTTVLVDNGATDSYILVSKTIGSVTRSDQIPVDIEEPNSVFNENSWDMIAALSAAGKAPDYWSIGDTKNITINGVDNTLRIIGFNHDDLSEYDEMYSTDYNAEADDVSEGKKYAGITLQFTEVIGQEKMNQTATNVGGWDTSYMRKTVMPEVFESLPSDLASIIRLVNKCTSPGGVTDSSVQDGRYTISADKLFFLSCAEYGNPDSISSYARNASAGERRHVKQYDWYKIEENLHVFGTNDEWTRSPIYPDLQGNRGRTFVMYNISNSANLTRDANEIHNYRPAFCV